MQLLDVDNLLFLINKLGKENFFDLLFVRLRQDFLSWDSFTKKSRHATHFPHGVIELMPISDEQYYAVKYVNGHPKNTSLGVPCVMALGLLARVADGMPLLFTEMTILTAIRTAAMSALVAQHAARPESSIFGFIGLGAQFEFQLLAFSRIFKIKTVVLFDLDEQAIIKARANIASYNLTIIIANNAAELVAMSDVVTLATATKLQAEIISFNDIPPGCHINAIGGDCPGKTELAINDFCNCKIIIEYHPQTIMEGEIQNAISELQIIEFHEILKGSSSARESADEITLFDSVGFALSDYSVLRLIYGLLAHDDIGISANFVPKISDPKNLFELLL